MKRQAGRPKDNGGQNDHHYQNGKSRDILAEQVDESAKQIQRYIRLTYITDDIREERRRSKWENL